MSGILGTADLAADTVTSLYECETDTLSVVQVNICNRHNEEITIEVAITDTEDVIDDNSMYIEYQTPIKPKGVLLRTGVIVPVGKFLTVKSSHSNVSAVTYGIVADTYTFA
jgi:hypothetical protein